MLVYKATNTVTGKSYIGFTKLSMWDRHRGHMECVRGGSSTYFHKSIRKYGLEVWFWEVLAECETRKDAAELEVSLIREHNTLAPAGYNTTTGGESAWTYSDELKRKLSEQKKGKPLSEKHKASLREAWARRERTSWNKGLKPTEEHRKNLSASLKGRIPWNKGKTGCFPEEGIRKMSAVRKGKPWTAARRAAQNRKKNAHID